MKFPRCSIPSPSPLQTRDFTQRQLTVPLRLREQSSPRGAAEPRGGRPPPPPGRGPAHAYLLDFGLQVAQLHALLQVLAVLLGGHVQLLLLLVEELQQILDAGCHVHVSVAKQLNACKQPAVYK